MSNPRGNPNWGKPEPLEQTLGASGFEQVVKALRLPPPNIETPLAVQSIQVSELGGALGRSQLPAPNR